MNQHQPNDQFIARAFFFKLIKFAAKNVVFITFIIKQLIINMSNQNLTNIKTDHLKKKQI